MQQRDEQRRADGAVVRSAVELTAELVRIPSANPAHGEAAVVDRIEAWLSEHTSAKLARVELEPGRESLAAVVAGRSANAPTLVLNGHVDTVPEGDHARWTRDPFSGTVLDGRIHGRGSCDMKAGVAIAMVALQIASRWADAMEGTLVVHFAVGEERGEAGTASLVEAGYGGDYAIVLEPTGLRVATACRGLATLDLVISGEPSHAGVPGAHNVLAESGAVLTAIAGYSDSLAARHPLLPPPSCSPTMCVAGTASNVVPASCAIVIDRRLVPGEDSETTRQDLERIAAAVVPGRYGVQATVRDGAFPPAESPADGWFAALVRERAAAVGGSSDPWGAPYACDLARLMGTLREGVIFGPGDLGLAHNYDEWVPEADIQAALDAVLDVARSVLAVTDG